MLIYVTKVWLEIKSLVDVYHTIRPGNFRGAQLCCTYYEQSPSNYICIYYRYIYIYIYMSKYDLGQTIYEFEKDRLHHIDFRWMLKFYRLLQIKQILAYLTCLPLFIDVSCQYFCEMTWKIQTMKFKSGIMLFTSTKKRLS